MIITDRRTAIKAEKQALAAAASMPPMPEVWQKKYGAAYEIYRQAGKAWDDHTVVGCLSELRRTLAIVNLLAKEEFDYRRAAYDDYMRHATRAWHAKRIWRWYHKGIYHPAAALRWVKCERPDRTTWIIHGSNIS